MEKEYLDALYEQREFIKGEIKSLSLRSNAPRVQCCEKMSSVKEEDIHLRELNVQLKMIDNFISLYLIIHRK